MWKRCSCLPLIGLMMILGAVASSATSRDRPEWLDEAINALESELVCDYGEPQRARAARGLRQVANFWRAQDGDRTTFEQLVRRHFAGDQATLDTMFARFEHLFEQYYGHMLEIILEFRRQSDLALGPILPIDSIFAGYDPSAHATDDFFANQIAFVVLLNFPLTSLEERLGEGDSWSRRQWAEARLAQQFSKRVPAAVQLELARAGAQADEYIAEYNIWMHHLLDDEGKRLFPPKLRLLSHWNLRDQIRADYSDAEHGLAKQSMVQKVMERIVTQTIPAAVIDNPHVDWRPYSNEVSPAAVNDSEAPQPAAFEVSSASEPDTRYATLLATFKASRLVDAYSPTAPTLMARRFDEHREIPEERVRQMLEQVLSSPLLREVAALIEQRLNRPLKPFDIWYSGFRSRGALSEAELDRLVAERYPSPEAYERDIPRLLVDLGFTPARAEAIAANIVVEPARGSGHAWGAGMRSAKSRLRTRVGPEGMDYKGFNIAAHEMGHNVEQTLSLNEIDHYMLEGVPNTAFTEALAFVFQQRDLELLGLASPSEEARALQVLDNFWGTAEISAVALVDMAVWHWMYAHPEATPAQLREATVEISKEVWNRFLAPVIGVQDVVLLGVYSHMIHSFLYLPDYPIGRMIALQIEAQMSKVGDVGGEFERMCKMGNVVPDLWMRHATGSPVGPEALLAATREALDRLRGD